MISEFIKSPFEFAWHLRKSRGRNTTAQNGKWCKVRISNSAPFLRPSLKVIIFTVLSFSLAHFIEPAHVRPRSDCSAFGFLDGGSIRTQHHHLPFLSLSFPTAAQRTSFEIKDYDLISICIKPFFIFPLWLKRQKDRIAAENVSRENGERSEDSHSIFLHHHILFVIARKEVLETYSREKPGFAIESGTNRSNVSFVLMNVPFTVTPNR